VLTARALAARALSAFVIVLLLAACAGSGRGDKDAVAPGAGTTVPEQAPAETALLWVTRDRGSELLLTAEVPAGLTVLQALDRETDLETRYAGRFVQAVNGIEGSLERQQDWFYFLNGIEPDVGAAEVKLRPGDVAWWDFRSWEEDPAQPAVVGAFPEPFRHGFAGRLRPVELRYPPALADAAGALRTLLGAGGASGEPNVFALEVREGETGAELTAARGAANDSPVTFTLSGSEGAVRAAALALARDPALVRYRYTARFDAEGRVVG
jgi:hypothetical protein